MEDVSSVRNMASMCMFTGFGSGDDNLFMMMINCRENINRSRTLVIMISITTGFSSWNRNKLSLIMQVYTIPYCCLP